MGSTAMCLMSRSDVLSASRELPVATPGRRIDDSPMRDAGCHAHPQSTAFMVTTPLSAAGAPKEAARNVDRP